MTKLYGILSSNFHAPISLAGPAAGLADSPGGDDRLRAAPVSRRLWPLRRTPGSPSADGSRRSNVCILPVDVSKRAIRAFGNRLVDRLPIRGYQPDDPALRVDKDSCEHER